MRITKLTDEIKTPFDRPGVQFFPRADQKENSAAPDVPTDQKPAAPAKGPPSDQDTEGTP